jgi:hypothetical protein
MAGWRNILRALVRQPVVHFLLLGGALFLVRAGLAPPAPPVATPPEPRPESPRREALTDDELLFREALSMGLDQEKPVRQRLIQNMRFLQIDKKAGDGELYRQAREIGFHRTDPVVRRFLVEQMRLLVRAGTGPEVFTEAELERYLKSHPERFTLPVFVRLTHVYLSVDQRGKTIERDAQRLLTRLRSERISPDAAPALGDPFLLGHQTGLVSSADLEPVYGAGLAREVMRLPVGVWSGPVESVQGLHLVWIHETREQEPAKLADVRSQVVLALAEKRQDARLAEHLRSLRESLQ